MLVNFYWCGLTLISAWINDHMFITCGMKLLILSKTSREDCEWISNAIPCFVIDVITYPWWIKVNPFDKGSHYHNIVKCVIAVRFVACGKPWSISDYCHVSAEKKTFFEWFEMSSPYPWGILCRGYIVWNIWLLYVWPRTAIASFCQLKCTGQGFVWGLSY